MQENAGDGFVLQYFYRKALDNSLSCWKPYPIIRMQKCIYLGTLSHSFASTAA